MAPVDGGACQCRGMNQRPRIHPVLPKSSQINASLTWYGLKLSITRGDRGTGDITNTNSIGDTMKLPGQAGRCALRNFTSNLPDVRRPIPLYKGTYVGVFKDDITDTF